MKTTLSLLLVFLPLYLFADSWDNLTREEAENVQFFLTDCPYILDYCDCCNYEGEYATQVHLMKVLSTEIVPCDWDENFLSVKALVKVIAQIPYGENGLDIKNPIETDYTSEELIYMNYTWSYNSELGLAVPFFCIIPYHYEDGENMKHGTCREFTSLPNPFNTSGTISDVDYKDWYLKNVRDKSSDLGNKVSDVKNEIKAATLKTN